MESKKYFICPLEQLQKQRCLAWTKIQEDQQLECFLVYHKQQVFSYINACPHTGVNLNWLPDQFLDSSGKLIQCAVHGALFDIENGNCLRGPCLGRALSAVQNVIIENRIFLIL